MVSSFTSLVHASLKDYVKLKPHQIEGVERMIDLEADFAGGILADEVST
jgi:SNF2 family DNA or RNA helicase